MIKPMVGCRMSYRPRQMGSGLARTAVSLALAGTLSACATFGFDGAHESGSGAKFPPAILKGAPDGLASRAGGVLETYGAPPASILEARRRADRAAATVEEFLASEGYLAATATPEQIDRADMTPGIQIEPGERFRIASVNMLLQGEVDEETRTTLDKARASLFVGGPARTSAIELLNTTLVNRLKDAGYAFATSSDIDVLASRAQSNVEITYILQPGPRVKLGQLILPEHTATRASAIGVMRTWQVGDIYTPEKIRTLRTRLRSAGLYDGIGIRISETADKDGTHPVELQLSESKTRSISFGASVSTTEGAGIDAFWERRNITGRGDTLRIDGSAANLGRGLKTTYELPNIGRYGRTLTAEVGARGVETDAYDLNGLRTGATLSQPFNKNFTLSAGTYVDVTRTIEYELTRAGPSDPIDQVTLSFPLSATYDTVANPLDPQYGNRLLATLEPSLSSGTRNAIYTRYLTSATTYHSFTEDLIGAVRAEAGGFLGDTDVPADRLFFAGGGGSVRGYPYQSLSPRNLDGDYVGGEALFNASFELRWRKSQRWGYTTFIDTGAAAGDFGEVFGDLRSAFGLGVRYYPGFGPIRVDIATPIDRREGEDPVQVYISIGQAF